MRYFYLFLSLTCLIWHPPSVAYDMGLKAGVTVTQHKIVNSMGQKIGSQSMGLGYTLGLFWDTPGEGLGTEFDFLFTQRSSVPSSVSDTDLVYTLMNIEIPWILYYRWSPVTFGTGAYLKYGVGKVHINGGTISPARSYSYGELGLLQYEMGALFSIGTKFDTGMGFVNLESRFHFGLSNRAKIKSGKTEFSSLSYDMLAGITF